MTDVFEKMRTRAARIDPEAVWSRLVSAHSGRANAVKVSSLGAEIGVKASRRTMQLIVNRLVEERLRPIGCSYQIPMGIYVAVTSEEKAECARQLQLLIIGLTKRLRAFTHASFEQTAGSCSASAESVAPKQNGLFS